MSLEQALSELWEEFTPGGARYQIFVLGKPKTLKPAIKEQIYLNGREAVLNALRHSGAAAIEAEVEYSARRLRVVVRDNGCGIDRQAVRSSPHSHWGLLGMRERAARPTFVCANETSSLFPILRPENGKDLRVVY
jgi:signal transduction histidine kinase